MEKKILRESIFGRGMPDVVGWRDYMFQAYARVCFAMRKNPYRYIHRFVYRDWFLKLIESHVSEEVSLFGRDWGGIIWDVGANVGKYTALLAKSNPDHLVYAFEPNLNSIYYLADMTHQFTNVVIVPCAITSHGRSLPGSYDPNFYAPATGPNVITLSLQEAFDKFGKPTFSKWDIEGGEYDLFSKYPESLVGSTLLIEWHKCYCSNEIPKFPFWKTRNLGAELPGTVTRLYEPI